MSVVKTERSDGCRRVHVSAELGIGIIDVTPQGIHDAEHTGTETYVIVCVAPEEAALLVLLLAPHLVRHPRQPAALERLWLCAREGGR